MFVINTKILKEKFIGKCDFERYKLVKNKKFFVIRIEMCYGEINVISFKFDKIKFWIFESIVGVKKL